MFLTWMVAAGLSFLGKSLSSNFHSRRLISFPQFTASPSGHECRQGSGLLGYGLSEIACLQVLSRSGQNWFWGVISCTEPCTVGFLQLPCWGTKSPNDQDTIDLRATRRGHHHSLCSLDPKSLQHTPLKRKDGWVKEGAKEGTHRFGLQC